MDFAFSIKLKYVQSDIKLFRLIDTSFCFMLRLGTNKATGDANVS